MLGIKMILPQHNDLRDHLAKFAFDIPQSDNRLPHVIDFCFLSEFFIKPVQTNRFKRFLYLLPRFQFLNLTNN